jgi:hypothetical protein
MTPDILHWSHSIKIENDGNYKWCFEKGMVESDNSLSTVWFQNLPEKSVENHKTSVW